MKQLSICEGFIGVFYHKGQAGVVGIVCLDNHSAIGIMAAGTARHLLEELVGFFICTKILNIKADVCQYNRHQRKVGKVQALGDHLCSDKDIYFIVLSYVYKLPQFF